MDNAGQVHLHPAAAESAEAKTAEIRPATWIYPELQAATPTNSEKMCFLTACPIH